MKPIADVIPTSGSAGRRRRDGRVALASSVLAFLVAAPARGAELAPAELAYFESKVRPLLIERCYECHGEEKQKGGLRLDSKAGWQRGGDRGPAVVPGDLEASVLIKAVTRKDAELQMPPKTPLDEGEVAVLIEWVNRGAPDPRIANESGAAAKSDGREHWAYQPLARPAPPAVRNAQWPRGDLDRFVLARLEAERLQPVADADPYTWLRRVSFDLTGLPPTPDEIAAFLGDTSHAARERVVDRLLASPAFGERWGRHWLDLVGYADQLGTVNDVPAPHAWRYRDYVIRALNADKPFDQFIREQVAGDLLPATDPEARREALIGTGFLLLGEIHIVTADKLQLRSDIVDHQIQKVGTAFLGQTLGCVRCHDHKFDPITLDDYYGLAGIFGSTESSYVTERGVWSSILATDLPETDAQRTDRERAWGDHLVKVEKTKAERAGLTTQLARLNQELTNASQVASAAKPDAGNFVASGAGNVGATESKPPDLKAQKEDLEKKIKNLDTRLLHFGYIEPKAAYSYSVREAAKPADGQVHVRGNARAPGRTVPRGFVRVVPSAPWPAIPAGASGRLELADWLAGEGNPLPARVHVNRVWYKLFGEGLVRSVDYFGTRGERPSHPDLLDWLAGEYVRNGWSQKKLIRAIALSRAYGLSGVNDAVAAARDPDNRLLWRMNRRRLDAEALRDAVLAVSGDLRPCDGGPALALHVLDNVGGLDPKDVNPVSFRTNVFPDEQHHYRTIYLPVVRSRAQPGPAELRNLFDFVPPTEMTGQRPSTSVATQALFLMNSEFMKAHAGKLAAWLLKEESADSRRRLETLYLRALGRPVTAGELDDAERFLGAVAGAEPEKQRAAWAEYCHALLSSNEFLFRL